MLSNTKDVLNYVVKLVTGANNKIIILIAEHSHSGVVSIHLCGVP